MKWNEEKYASFVEEFENKEPGLLFFIFIVPSILKLIAPSLDSIQGELDENKFFFNEDQVSINLEPNNLKKQKVEAEDDEVIAEGDDDLDNTPTEFVLPHTGSFIFFSSSEALYYSHPQGEKLAQILSQIKQMIKAGILPQYINMTANEDNSVFLLRNKEDFGTYTNNKNIIEAVFIKSTHIDFETSSESECEEPEEL